MSGVLSAYQFEDLNAGTLPATFHRIKIQLTPFSSGLDGEDEFVSTEIVFEWIKTPLLSLLVGESVDLALQDGEEIEASIYLGHSHNPIDLNCLEISRVSTSKFKINAELNIDFEFEGVAQAEGFDFQSLILVF